MKTNALHLAIKGQDVAKIFWLKLLLKNIKPQLLQVEVQGDASEELPKTKKGKHCRYGCYRLDFRKHRKGHLA